MAKNLAVALLVIILFTGQLTDALECYVCYYDESILDFRGGYLNTRACADEGISRDNVPIRSGFRTCNSALLFENGEVTSVIRGGNQQYLEDFTARADRAENEFVVTYCNTNLCNSSTSLRSGMALGFLSLIISKLR